ncbi:class II fructose-bisphosphate aldolase [Candidatus Gracilibacteria bacterium]|nr:class II fructose-bisphosphate aldolase [Candidatus Gracilibacteria bacterium]
MFLNLTQLLTPAYHEHFGVLSCNIRHPLIMQGVLQAAFRDRSPIILEIAESEQAYCGWAPEQVVVDVCDYLAQLHKQYGYMIPIGLHLDHVQRDESLIVRAVEAGFRSALLDLSKLSDTENYQRCAAMRAYLDSVGASLEIEKGIIGFAKDLPDDVEQLYTSVEDAVAAVEVVRPHALAIAVGNGHGLYTETPHIGFDRIALIAQALAKYQTPLVLHGGSGLSLEAFAHAVDVGIQKVNYATALSDVLFAHLPADLRQSMDAAASMQSAELRKVLGQFKQSITDLPIAITAMITDAIAEHVHSVLREGMHSTNKAELYRVQL